MYPSQGWPQLLRRKRAPELLLYVLISFGASVIVTRVLLSLLNYPRLGTSSLHIAHLLWGGLLLSAAALLMLVFASPSVNRIGAILTGLGIGLFIDEVGKFITVNNDYFYRAAAPIIYLVFLLIALLYHQLQRRSRTLTNAELLCAALEDAESFLESNPYEHQKADLVATVATLETQDINADHVALARALLRFVESEAVRPGKHWWDRSIERIEQALQSLFERHERFFTALLLFLLADRALSSLIGQLANALFVLLATVEAEGVRVWLGQLDMYLDLPLVVDWPLLILNVVTSGIMLIGVALFVFRRRERGLYWMQTSLLLSLCVVNVFAFYEQQFIAVLYCLVDLVIMLYVRAYLYRRQQQQTGPASLSLLQ